MPGRRFSRISFSSLERKSGPQLHPAPVFGPAHLLQILACPKKARARSQCRSAVAKAAKAIADRAHEATNGGASFHPTACEKTIRRSGLDAATRFRSEERRVGKECRWSW